uniref:Uncharacterized protein n=1 Tax=Coturnix japonica TaxID=93934 RepID=A0A8C2YDH8_COTJA
MGGAEQHWNGFGKGGLKTGMMRVVSTASRCLLLLHRVRFSLKSDYLPGTRKILTAAPEKQTQLRHGAIRWNRHCTRAPIAELEGFFSFVIPPMTIPDVSCSGSFLFFLADGSDGITLPAHGNKQEMGRGSSASCLRYHSLADLLGATPLYPTVPPHLVLQLQPIGHQCFPAATRDSQALH